MHIPQNCPRLGSNRGNNMSKPMESCTAEKGMRLRYKNATRPDTGGVENPAHSPILLYARTGYPGHPPALGRGGRRQGEIEQR